MTIYIMGKPVSTTNYRPNTDYATKPKEVKKDPMLPVRERSKELMEKALCLFKQGLHPETIAKELALCEKSVRNYLKKAGCVFPKRKLSDEKIAEIQRLNTEGVIEHHIAKMANVSVGAVRKYTGKS